ncbi:hypothetical protein [Rosettibacter firmus]|uniref:hypothetical protein n=1 Tax=Rosettibacter firmus TaxID=3111522 RepID=UPI00336C1F1C
MKKIILSILLVVVLIYGCSESTKNESERLVKRSDSLKNVTKLQNFLAQKGTLIIKDFYKLGKISGLYWTDMKFDAIVFYEPGKEEERVKGLKIEVTELKTYGEHSEAAFLDLEELESLSKALQYMTTLKEYWKDKPKEYTEVIFETKGNFKTGFFKRKDEIQAFASCGYGSEVNCFFKATDELLGIKNKIDEAITLLKKK